jgi:hypothetical protein
MTHLSDHVALVDLRGRIDDALSLLPKNIHPQHVVAVVTDTLARLLVQCVLEESLDAVATETAAALRRRVIHHHNQTVQQAELSLCPTQH